MLSAKFHALLLKHSRHYLLNNMFIRVHQRFSCIVGWTVTLNFADHDGHHLY